jgi:tetratricopeptide (TPR) repeat protein
MGSSVNIFGFGLHPLCGKARLNRAIAIAAIGFLALASSSYAAGANRAESDTVVAEAEKLITQAGQADPVDSKLIHQAMDKLRVAIKIDPRNDAAYVDLGFCYGVLRDGTTAVDMYRTATDLNPSGNNFIELSDIYMRVGDPEDALLAANAGLVKDPSNARLYNAKGMALNDMQRFGEAEEAWEKALQLNPNLKVAEVNLEALNAGPSGRGSVSKHSRQPPPSSPTH